ncbi:hypothetical protein evm_011457, partial [Chilo suppressalis]
VKYVLESSITDGINNTIDIYANPMSMGPEIMDVANPVHTVLLWRFGFIFRRPYHFSVFLRYYSKPFSRPVWNCLYAMMILVTLLFYILSCLEKRFVRTKYECTFGLYLMLAIGGYCQHVFPVDAIFNSRRTAHFTFFLYCYIIYTFYTSNLLSHLVSDKANEVQLDDLTESDYEIIILESMKDVYYNNYTWYSGHSNLTDVIRPKLNRARFVNMATAVKDLRLKKSALLSDYISVYPALKRAFSNDEICQLNEIDLLPEVRKYLFSSKNFRFREQLVIGTLRAKEAGVLHRLTSFDSNQHLNCNRLGLHVVEISQIYTPLMYLASAYVIASVIMLCERWYCRSYKATHWLFHSSSPGTRSQIDDPDVI